MCFAALLLALGLLLLFYALCRNPDFRACKCLCGGGAAPDRSGPRAELGSRKRGPVEAKNKGSASRDALPPSPTSNGEWVVKGIVIQEGSSWTAPALAKAAIDHGLLLVAAGPSVLRMVPPLTINKSEVRELLRRLAATLSSLS